MAPEFEQMIVKRGRLRPAVVSRFCPLKSDPKSEFSKAEKCRVILPVSSQAASSLMRVQFYERVSERIASHFALQSYLFRSQTSVSDVTEENSQ